MFKVPPGTILYAGACCNLNAPPVLQQPLTLEVLVYV